MNYKLYAEDENNYYFRTGVITGDWMKFEERIALCKLCGMEYQLPQRHGALDLEHCYPEGLGSTNDGAVCTECGRNTDKAVTLRYNEIEHVAICPGCLQAHHGLDYFQFKYHLLRMVTMLQREIWRNLHES